MVLTDANLWTQFSEQNERVFVKKFLSRVRLNNFLRRFALYHNVVEVQLQNYNPRYKSKFVPVDSARDELLWNSRRKIQTRFSARRSTSLRHRAFDPVQPAILFIPTQDAPLATNSFTANVLRAKKATVEKYSVSLLDLTPDLQPKAKDLYLVADPVHLNVAGDEIIGRRLADALEPLLKR